MSESEIQISREEYALKAPKVPRQSVDVFGRDLKKGNYGFPAEVIDTIYEYVSLGQMVDSFGHLTFSKKFLAKLPQEYREKLDQNLYPGIPLSELQLPLTDKVTLVELVTADALSDILSDGPVEVWVNSDIQKKLHAQGVDVPLGLQEMNYSELPLVVQRFLVGVMEYQELQIHQILAAGAHFPDGVPELRGFGSFLTQNEEAKTIHFDRLENLDEQFDTAIDVLNNPIKLLLQEMIIASERHIQTERDVRESDTVGRRRSREKEYKFPPNLELAAEGDWWVREFIGFGVDSRREVADYLRPKYERKSIYQIFNAATVAERKEIFAAFWRRIGSKRIDFGEEGWIKNDLYLRKNGRLELHSFDSLYNNRSKRKVTGLLKSYFDVACVDQAVQWITEELKAMQSVKDKWEHSGFSTQPIVESTLLLRLDDSFRDAHLQEEIDNMPPWFLDVINQELRYYHQLPLEYHPRARIEDLFSLSFLDETPKSKNLLKGYFIQARQTLSRYQNLLFSSSSLYEVLGLPVTATDEDIKDAYRAIAKETQAIQINSPDDFDPTSWDAMNEKFIAATRAYKALVKGKRVDASSVTMLGKLTTYFS